MSTPAKLDHLRKLCECPRRKWAKCSHDWYFHFMNRGEHHRFSLDKRLGRRIESQTDAEAERDKFCASIREGTFLKPAEGPSPDGLTVRELLDRYRDSRSRTRPFSEAALTAHNYAANAICKTVVPNHAGADQPLGTWLVRHVTTDTLEQFIDRRGPSVATNRYLTKLQAAFTWGLSRLRRYVVENPFRDGEKRAFEPFKEQARTRRLQPGEAERLLSVCNDDLRGIVECALETGMRRGEILSLQWSQIKWAPKPEILLPASKTKTRRDRTIPVSARLLAILEMRRLSASGQEHAPDAYVFGSKQTGERVLGFKRAWSCAILKAHRHKPTYVSGSNLSPASRAALREINLHFHDLRREAGSRWMDAGYPLSAVQALLGHANVSQTSTYLQVTDRGLHELFERFDRQRGLLQTIANRDETGVTTSPPTSMETEESPRNSAVVLN